MTTPLAFLGAGAALPLSATAQTIGGTRRIGILHDYAEGDPEGRAQISAFRDELARLGWIDGKNIVFDLRTAGNLETDQLRGPVRELLALLPDILLASGGSIAAALQRASRSVPIVFVNVTDPLGAGVVSSLARPGGNATGFTQFEFGISAKWLELLKEMAPQLTRIAVIRDPTARSGGGQLGAVQAMAPSLGMDVKPVDAADPEEMRRDLEEFSRGGRGGLIVTSSRLARGHRDQIVALAARYRLPAIYAFRVYVSDGGLMSYGPDATASYRRAAGYVDRVLKGEKPAELPVQAPTKYELSINLVAAKAMGHAVPHSLLARADEVIE